jgi:hypothetical protein
MVSILAQQEVAATLWVAALEFVHFWEKVGQTIVVRGLLGWAFRPRNFMKNHARLREIPDGRDGFSTLSCLARHSPV